MLKDQRSADATPWLLSIAVAALMAAILNFQGRIWWCPLGDRAIYINDAWNSSHTSQHFLDPYTFTHILHGVSFFWLTSLIFSRLSAAGDFLLEWRPRRDGKYLRTLITSLKNIAQTLPRWTISVIRSRIRSEILLPARSVSG